MPLQHFHSIHDLLFMGEGERRHVYLFIEFMGYTVCHDKGLQCTTELKSLGETIQKIKTSSNLAQGLKSSFKWGQGRDNMNLRMIFQ